jgi:uncharacterized protein (UPF0333 family)
MIRYCTNLPVTDYKVQALTYYHWFITCCQFTEVQASGNWSAVLSGSDGIINTSIANKFSTVAATFTAGHVGMFLVVRDASNPENTAIGVINTVDSSTLVTLTAITQFTANSTNVNYRIVDPSDMPALGDYFVIQNPVASQPRWQLRVSIEASAVGLRFAPVGGWNLESQAWTLPVCSDILMPDTLAQSFVLSDPEEGWAFLWTEETGGVSSNRNGVWLGTLAPFHAPRVVGAPSDESYAVIFGNRSGSTCGLFSRNNSLVTSISTGQGLNYDNTIIPIYWAQKKLFGTGTDTQTMSGANPNPWSGENDDYDIIAFHKSSNKAIRGRVPGVRLLNEGLANRTKPSATTYVIGGGIGAVWNTKPAL